MIAYLTKQFQAVPALMAIYKETGGVFVSTRASTIKAIKKNNPTASVCNYLEILGRFSSGHKLLAKADVIVTGAPNQEILAKFSAPKYMIFTGTSLAMTTKKAKAELSHFDKLCAIGPRMIRTLERAGITVATMQTGYFPFLNFPEKNDENRQAILKTIGMDDGKKNIVYVPRGKPNGSFDLMMPRFLEQMPKTDFNFIVRPHPSQSVKMHIHDRLLFMRLQKEIKFHKNIYLDLNHLKLSDLLSVADLVISDGNSPAEESLFYDTPQVLVETDRLSRASIGKYMRGNAASEEDIGLALSTYDNGPIMTPFEGDFIGFIEKAMDTASNYAEARKASFKFIFGDRDFSRQFSLINELRKCAD